MTPSPPDEALHFRGKTLTPESPRPLHVPEPANIPVLENQMDPVFNDTSTYQRPKHSQEPEQAHNVGWSHGRQDETDNQDPGSLHAGSRRAMHNDITATNFFPASSPSQMASSSFGNMPSYAPPVVPVSQGVASASEIDHSAAPQPNRLDDNRGATGAGGVDLQNLLHNFAAAPAASATGPAPSLAEDSSPPQAPTGESSHAPDIPLRSLAQDLSTSHPSYTPAEAAHGYHQFPVSNNTAPSYATQPSNQLHHHLAPQLAPLDHPDAVPGNGALPPPIASFQQPSSAGAGSQASSQEPPAQGPLKKGRVENLPGRSGKGSDDDAPWAPEVQKKYDEFLHDERVYVTEGLWDRFPVGSRLFVGNLPTERVTKRDMFHIFHKYGKLAQISIKQAYGFIQFLEAESCHAALQAQQGALVRGRKIHLEISKPQRSTRPAPTAEPPRPPPPRHSRSPEFARGTAARKEVRAPGDRYDRPYEPSRLPFSDFREEHSHRRRDDYRPPRSPSPLPRRSREGYRSRDRTPERFDRRERRRSRSPRSPRSSRSPRSPRSRRYRSPSPRPRGSYEGEADLPVPRRAPRDVPEVQILVLEEVDRNFILHVENAFRNRGLRVDVLVLGPRIPLAAAVHRQIVEGVLAVVRLSRSNQYSRKIPLQVIDRSAGLDNPRFNDYPEVDPNIAAEVIFHQSQAMQRGVPGSFAPNPVFGVPAMPAVPVTQPGLPSLSNPPNLANLISSLDGPSLQSLLAALQQRPPQSQPVSANQSPFSSPHPPPPANLASLLTNAARPPPPTVPANSQQPFPPPFTLQRSNAPVISDPNLFSLLAKGLGGQQQQQQQQGQASVGPQVQNIMDQLAKWKQ